MGEGMVRVGEGTVIVWVMDGECGVMINEGMVRVWGEGW